MIDVYLLLGSNLGDRRLFLTRAIAFIETEISPVFKSSSIYETQAWGKDNEPDYLNQVLWIKTSMPAADILQSILAIENKLGRIRTEKWGSRVIDIDLLFYGDRVIDAPGLVVPHPQLHLRKFTLEPLSEIAPGFIHPVFKKNIAQLNAEIAGVVNKI